MKEYQHHVRKKDKVAYCGAECRHYEFYLSGPNHARDCVKHETRVQPCPECWAIIEKGEA